MKVYVGADHGGFRLAEQVLLWGKEQTVDMQYVGAITYNKDDDFVEFAESVAQKVMEDIVAGRDARGIVICRNGVGVDITANKKRYIRCCLGFNEEQIRKARTDDDVNMLSLPADYIDVAAAKQFVSTFLRTPFAKEERFVRRISKIENIRNV